MIEQPELSEVRRLVGLATSRFSTLRAKVQVWSHYRRISELQGLGWDGVSEEEGDRVTQVWIGKDRSVREERDTGEVERFESLKDSSYWPLFDSAWLAEEAQLKILRTLEVAARSGLAVETPNPARGLDVLPGADRCVCVVDLERGVILRCESFLGDELLSIEEVTEITFDEPNEKV